MSKKSPNPEQPDESNEAQTVSAVKAEQLRTQNDLYRESIGHEIVRVAESLREAREELDRLKTIAKDAKSDVDEQSEEVSSLNGQLTQLAMDMARVEEGTYEPRATQQTLPFGSQTTQRVATAADQASLAELLIHGCPKGLISSLASSQLAAERKLETVGDLLAAIQADDYWYKKIKGMGEERREKLIDAITAWGQANPEPEVSDHRVKQCLRTDCHELPSRGIFFTDSHGVECCQDCGSTYFELIDPPASL